MTSSNNLRGAAERMIVNPYKLRYKKGKINIICAPTGFGKTYHIMNTIIPFDIKQGINHCIVLTVYKENVHQDEKNYRRALNGIAHVTTDIEDFLGWDYELENKPIVYIGTISGASTGGSRSDESDRNSNRIIKFVEEKKGKVSVYWDEAHFAASSTPEALSYNQCMPSVNFTYNSVYYSLIEECVKRKCKVTGFTATPVFEQKGFLDHFPGVSRGYYELITNESDWPTPLERTECVSQYRDIIIYDKDRDYSYIVKKFLSDFNSANEKMKISADYLNKEVLKLDSSELKFNATNKMIALISVSKENTKSGLDKEDAIDTILDFYQGKIDEDDYFLLLATQEGYFLYNTAGDRKHIKEKNKDLVFKYISDNNHPLRIVVFIEKFKFGLNIPNANYVLFLRERNTKEGLNGQYYTAPIIQTFGRVVRNWFAIEKKGLKLDFTSQSINFLDNFSETIIYDVLKDHMSFADSHVIYAPDSPSYLKAIEQWKKSYAVSYEMSQFNNLKKPTESGCLPVDDNTSYNCPTCGKSGYYHINCTTPVDNDTMSKALGIKTVH